MTTEKHFLSTPEAAQYLGGLCAGTLNQWRCRGDGPRYVKIGRLVKYRIQDLDAWIEDQSRSSTSEVA